MKAPNTNAQKNSQLTVVEMFTTVAVGTPCQFPLICVFATPQKEIKTELRFRRMLEPIDDLSPPLASLRQEITDLRNMNLLYSQQSLHSAVEQTASDVRASRLLQIMQELSKVRDCPPEPRVWWDKVRNPKRAA